MTGKEKNGNAIVTVNTALPFRTEVGRTNITADTVLTVAVAAAIVDVRDNCSLSDLEFRIVRYVSFMTV
jgi:hypothetical protein